jgi:hypothetical protein
MEKFTMRDDEMKVVDVSRRFIQLFKKRSEGSWEIVTNLPGHSKTFNSLFEELSEFFDPGDAWLVWFDGGLIGAELPAFSTATIRLGKCHNHEIHDAADFMKLIEEKSGTEYPDSLRELQLPANAIRRVVQAAGRENWNAAFLVTSTMTDQVLKVAIRKGASNWNLF